jgi:uroporphyrinogen-III synthase
MRLLLTRPTIDSESIARQLRDQSISAVIDPLLSFALLDIKDLSLSSYQAIIFTSTNGIRAFEKFPFERNIKVFTVGDKTAELAKTLSFQSVTSAGGDLIKLSNTIKDQLNPNDGPLLYICGKHQAGDLKQDMITHGFALDKLEIYDMVAATNLSEPTKNSLKNQEIDYIPFYSVRSAHIFIELVKNAELQNALSNISALCLSPAIEKVIKTHCWKNIMTAEKPNQYSLFKLIDIEL